MNKIVEKTKQFIFAKQSDIFSSAMILSAMILISSFFGFLRFRILSGFFSKEQLDIFFASFRIPDLVFEILITGALTSTFIPIFIKYKGNEEQLRKNISSIINIILILLLLFVAVLFIGMGVLIPLITPGMDQQRTEYVIYFSRLLLVGQLPFLIIGNILTGIGQANKRFFLSALAPIVYNLSIIVATILFAPSLLLLAPVIGVVGGALLFLFLQLPLIWDSGYRYQWVIEKTEGLKEFVRIIIPRTLTVVVAQIDATIDLTLTTLLGAGSYTIFYLAQRLQLLPVSVIGIAFGQASLPYLTEVYQADKREEFKKIVVDSILNLFFFTIPIASFFIFARTPIVRLFFGGQKFDWDATVSTAITLSYFSVSLPFHTIYYFLTRCFYATLDTRTPFYISVVSIAINTLLSIIFVLILKLPVWFLSISFSISMIINVTILFIILSSKIKGFAYRFLAVETGKMLVATAIPSVIVYYLMKFMDELIFDTSFTLNVLMLLFSGLIIYFLLYIFLSWLLDVKEFYLVSKLIVKAKEYRQKIVEFYTSYE